MKHRVRLQFYRQLSSRNITWVNRIWIDIRTNDLINSELSSLKYYETQNTN